MKQIATICLILLISGGHTVFPQHQKHLNLIVIVDVSDRIAIPGQVSRDTQLIHALSGFVESNVKQNFRINSIASFSVLILSQDGITMPEAEKALFLDMENISPAKRASNSISFFESVPEKTEALYSFAYKGPDYQQYFGCELLPTLIKIRSYYLKSSPVFQNVIVLMSDGYIDFQNYEKVDTEVIKHRYTSTRFFDKLRINPEFDLGIYPVSLTGSKFILCEVNPKYDRNFEEFGMIEKTWRKWASESGTDLYLLANNMPVEKVINEIKAFIR